MFASSGQDVIYTSERNHDSDVKISHLKELILALDELAIETDGGNYPDWVYIDVKAMYQLLRSTFEQLISGRPIQTTRQQLLDRVHKIRSDIRMYTENRRNSSPRRESRLTTLISHCNGAEYCKNVFHTQRHRGRLVHTPGPPNPHPDAVIHEHRSRRWLAETEQLSGKTTTRKKQDLKLILLKERAQSLEQQLQSELRRELRSEQAIARLREEDRWGIDQMLNKLDYLAEILKSRHPTRSQTPPPPPPKREIIVDNSRMEELEAELAGTRKQLAKDVAEREGRIETLIQEAKLLRSQLNDLQREKLQLENELARLKANEGDGKKVLEEKIERLNEKIKELTRSERRLSKREHQLSEDKTELERRIEELQSDLNRAKKSAEDLQARLVARQQEIQAIPPPLPPTESLFTVVTKVLYRFYLNKFRKESKIRSDLQATLDMTANAAERARKLSEQEQNALRASLLAEIDALRNQLDSKELTIRELQNQTDSLLKERGDLERRLTDNFEADRRKSLEEIAQLQLQLIQAKSETKSEPVAPDIEPFKKMLLESFQGDYLHLEENPSVLHVMFSQGDERVMFSDRIEKLNHRNFKEKRIIVISHNALYLLMPKAWELKRVVKIDDIDKITMSRRSADHICIHHRSEEDIFFISSKRYEIVHFLMNAFKHKTSDNLAYHFAERFYVEDRDMHYRLVEVQDTSTVKLGRSVLLGPT